MLGADSLHRMCLMYIPLAGIAATVQPKLPK